MGSDVTNFQIAVQVTDMRNTQKLRRDVRSSLGFVQAHCNVSVSMFMCVSIYACSVFGLFICL